MTAARHKVISRPGAQPAKPESGLPFLSIGFRPLFLCAAAFAPLALVYFIYTFAHGSTSWPSRFSAVDWHRHEMIFGYAMAIIAGFLFTAVKNWTSQPTPKGAWLAAIAGIWIVGRVAVLFSASMPALEAMILDLLFPLAVAFGIAIPLIKAKNKRNVFFIVLLLLLAVANGLTWLGQSDLGIAIALNIVLMMIIIIGGRVIAMFTERPLGLMLKRHPKVDVIVLVTSLAAFLLEIATHLYDGLPRPIIGTAFLFAATANAWRFSSWETLKTGKHALIWVLHAGYAWLIVGLAFKAAHFLGADISFSIATHALTSGAIGVMTLGFISRVALGHTGRPLVAGTDMAVAFWLINLAAFCRVFGMWLLPEGSRTFYTLAAAFWCLAFVFFLYRYTPYLLSPRADESPRSKST
ncbi:NnrS family protein [Asticcacaulis sp. BYS171W]|uniref:NnrS family protein n=1 Tax=Asticcacaulis aquaticus TaxID=2984212 RepID=A0ABT5HWJ6_9CAUL|nr:NnrS family protein [Asticcacaulis aquaticus]MDC7684446.1 NnrS family protein [Asticcacaulis aquaticus]